MNKVLKLNFIVVSAFLLFASLMGFNFAFAEDGLDIEDSLGSANSQLDAEYDKNSLKDETATSDSTTLENVETVAVTETNGTEKTTVVTPKFESYELPYADVYNYEYYSANNPDVVAAFSGDRRAIFNHFLNWGMSEGRKGNETFDLLSYFNQYGDLRSAYQTNLKMYYLHYLNFGRYEGRLSSGCDTLLGLTTSLNGTNYSPVYDPNFYMKNNSDVVAAYTYRGAFVNDVAILQHFIAYGMNEGRLGSDSFHVLWYYNRYADIRAAYGTDLRSVYTHYLNFGMREGRNVTKCEQFTEWITRGWDAVYNPEYYYKNQGDLNSIATKRLAQGTFIDDNWLWSHMYNYGRYEWRSTSPNFDAGSYYNANPDLRATYKGDTGAYYEHYVNFGSHEGRTCKGVNNLIGKLTSYDNFNYEKVYNPDSYCNAYSDINYNGYFWRGGKCYLNDGWAIWHFVNYGMNEERVGNGSFSVRSYWNQYSDVRRAFGSNWALLYRHYCTDGWSQGRSPNGCASLTGDVNFDNQLIQLTRQYPTLWSSFDWVCSFPYQKSYEWPSWSNWKMDMAKAMLNYGSGNCYCYATLFMYMAQALGYDADVRCGEVLQRSGWAAHGWTEIYLNGGTYICDGSFYHSLRMDGFFMVPYSNARVNYRISY